MKAFSYSIVLGLFFSLFFKTTLSAQTVYEDSWFDIKAEDNVCYVDAFETDLLEFDEKEYFVYTGIEENRNNKKYLKKIGVVQLQEPKSKWAKINRVSDCLSADPVDCLSQRRRSDWYGLRYITKWVVTDSTEGRDFETQRLKTAKLIERRNGIKKVRALCGNDLTPAMQQSIINSLQEKGYLASGFTNVQNRLVKEAIFTYQVHHSLPLGYLDMETLSSLNVLTDF